MSAISRIELGVKLLDQKMPGWERKIDIKKLDLRYSNTCILGQLFHDGYIEGYTVMFPDAKGTREASRESFKHGFSAHVGPLFDSKSEKLSKEWKRILYLRKAARNSEPSVAVGDRYVKA